MNIYHGSYVIVEKPEIIQSNRLLDFGTGLYEEGVAVYNELSDAEFKKLIRKQYNYIKQIAKEGFY